VVFPFFNSLKVVMSHYADSSASSQGAFQSSYSLPKLSETPTEDDLRKLQDRKEKKKLQNRVAQRTYRNPPSVTALGAMLKRTRKTHESAP